MWVWTTVATRLGRALRARITTTLPEDVFQLTNNKPRSTTRAAGPVEVEWRHQFKHTPETETRNKKPRGQKPAGRNPNLQRVQYGKCTTNRRPQAACWLRY